MILWCQRLPKSTWMTGPSMMPRPANGCRSMPPRPIRCFMARCAKWLGYKRYLLVFLLLYGRGDFLQRQSSTGSHTFRAFTGWSQQGELSFATCNGGLALLTSCSWSPLPLEKGVCLRPHTGHIGIRYHMLSKGGPRASTTDAFLT